MGIYTFCKTNPFFSLNTFILQKCVIYSVLCDPKMEELVLGVENISNFVMLEFYKKRAILLFRVDNYKMHQKMASVTEQQANIDPDTKGENSQNMS